uniref:F-box domain-containing protein n=1 Tax=Kalanchoe fedtschenkoi TaxID=63787 RepID=A0A7N0TDS9_KALFE
MAEDTNAPKRPTGFNINDDADVLMEVLSRLDDRSLGVAACVCRLWSSITRDDAFWEMLCFRHASPAPRVRQVVVALGGYRKLYMVCVRRRVMGRLGPERGWTREEVQLWLSLFCVDCYERLGGKQGSDGGGDGLMTEAPSLMFLCEPVNV